MLQVSHNKDGKGQMYMKSGFCYFEYLEVHLFSVEMKEWFDVHRSSALLTP